MLTFQNQEEAERNLIDFEMQFKEISLFGVWRMQT